MTTIQFLDHLFSVIDEILFPAFAAWGLHMLRRWLQRGLPK